MNAQIFFWTTYKRNNRVNLMSFQIKKKKSDFDTIPIYIINHLSSILIFQHYEPTLCTNTINTN